MRWSEVIYAFLLIAALVGAHKIGEIEGHADGRQEAIRDIQIYTQATIDAAARIR